MCMPSRSGGGSTVVQQAAYDPAAERAAAALAATQSANAKLIEERRRRRAQQSLLGSTDEQIDTLGGTPGQARPNPYRGIQGRIYDIGSGIISNAARPMSGGSVLGSGRPVSRSNAVA